MSLYRANAAVFEVRYLSPLMHGWGNTINFGGRSVSEGVSTFGIAFEFHRITRRAIIKGGPNTPLHVENRSPVCLIGPEIESRLFRDVVPLGQIIFISKQNGAAYPCRVIEALRSE